MTDFPRWLYVNYVKPRLGDLYPPDSELPIPPMESLQDADLELLCERAVEFYAGRAFLLGLRTGEGLYASQGSLGSTQPSI